MYLYLKINKTSICKGILLKANRKPMKSFAMSKYDDVVVFKILRTKIWIQFLGASKNGMQSHPTLAPNFGATSSHN